MSKVNREVAEKEIEGWLEIKKISESKREAQKDSIKTLVDAICDGSLSLKEDKTFVHELLHPVGEDSTVSKLEYKPRITAGHVYKHLEGVKSADIDGRICATIAALTSKTKGVIRLLDTEDYAIASSIAIFFL